MTRTAVASDDGDEREDLLAELAGLLRKHGHADADDVWTEIHALAGKVDKLAETARQARCSGCCSHGHTYWYPATTYGTTALPSTYTVSYGTT